MVLSSTGLIEINATTLRVLETGQLVDVLTLTAGGSPDIALGGLSIAQMDGLQAQLNAKATTAALSAAAVSLGAEIDVLETGGLRGRRGRGEPRRRGRHQGCAGLAGCDQHDRGHQGLAVGSRCSFSQSQHRGDKLK